MQMFCLHEYLCTTNIASAFGGEEGIKSSENGATNGCECYVGARTQTWVLSKSRQYSKLLSPISQAP